MRYAACLLAVLALAPVAMADTGTIGLTLDAAPAGGYYTLVGQSNFFQIRTNSGTGGNPLDGKSTPGEDIVFAEVFPPTSLYDYLSFGYFGIVETYDSDDNLLNTSLVVAFKNGFGVGDPISSFFPYTAGQLIAAFTGSFDSAEFLDVGENIAGTGVNTGAIGLPQISVAGETLTLVAFDEEDGAGYAIGSVNLTITEGTVPEPASMSLLAIGGLALIRRRTRA